MISSHVEIYAVKCAESMIGRLGRVKGKGARSDWLSKRGRLSCRGQDVIEDTAVESRLTYASPLQSWVEETERKMLTHTLTNSIDIAYPSMRSDGFCIWYHNWFSYTRAVTPKLIKATMVRQRTSVCNSCHCLQSKRLSPLT